MFLHRLWNLILDTKRPALMGSSVPLLTVISRGIRLSTQERDAIGEFYANFVRKRTLVKYQFQSEVIKVMLFTLEITVKFLF